MKTRRFRGKNLREALDKVKAALGEDAIIVSTRKADGAGGDFGSGASCVEVEATAPILEEGKNGAGQTDESRYSDFDDIQDPGDLAALFGEKPVSTMDEPALGAPIADAPIAEGGAEVSDLFYELCDTGVGEDTAREIISRASEEGGGSGEDSPGGLREQVKNMIALLFEVSGPIAGQTEGKGEGPQICNFIGPTGAGKTTTIAKIAARCTKRRLKVGLITLDTQRAGGAEHMKKLADSLRLPLIIAASRDQLDQALAKFRRADVILVDSPGRSIGNEAGMRELEAFFGEGRPGENYLVLAANTHSEDLRRMGESFSRVPLGGLIFTKLDEASRFGVIFELHMDLGVPVAYLTLGQRIPGNLEEASPERLARLVLSPESEWVSAREVAV